ncbi:hypothetical protein HZA44_02940 [Candidatus Peregrinibacteria bacterium]|nr:hypothetical protein [Candidatus Peregrinibacteria bacterium]
MTKEPFFGKMGFRQKKACHFKTFPVFMDTPKWGSPNERALRESDLQVEPNKLDSTARLKMKRVLGHTEATGLPTMGSAHVFFSRRVKIIESRVLSNEIRQFQMEFLDDPNAHEEASTEAKGAKKWIGDWMLKRMVPIDE